MRKPAVKGNMRRKADFSGFFRIGIGRAPRPPRSATMAQVGQTKGE
jgi:hypothetical protein